MEFGEVNFAFQQTMLSHADRELAKAILAREWIPETIFRPPPTTPEEWPGTAYACFAIAFSRTIKPFGLAASGTHASAADLSFSSH